jgi:hypothetical protein
MARNDSPLNVYLRIQKRLEETRALWTLDELRALLDDDAARNLTRRELEAFRDITRERV